MGDLWGIEGFKGGTLILSKSSKETVKKSQIGEIGKNGKNLIFFNENGRLKMH